MDSTKVLSLLEDLDDEIDDLEESLAPLLRSDFSEIISKLPLFDKAKLYVLVTYAIESILFSYLRLHGVNAREHPVFLELTRVKQYFDKIKRAEVPAALRNKILDKGAASRFIKADLAGNERYDLQRAEQQAKERARAHIRFKDPQIALQKRKSESVEVEANSESHGTIPKPNPHDLPKPQILNEKSPETIEEKFSNQSAGSSNLRSPIISTSTCVNNHQGKQATISDDMDSSRSEKKKKTRKAKKQRLN